MKKLALTLCLAALSTGAFAQGLVNFFNNATTLVSSDGAQTGTVVPGYYFGLFTAPQGTTDYNLFTFTGAYGTNQATAGRMSGGGNLAVPGWAAGATKSFYVLGWSASYGKDAAAVLGYLSANLGPVPGTIGRSVIATGAAGGFDGVGTVPNLNIFGLATVNAGFNMAVIPVPEPSSFALAGLGAAAMLIFRRRK